MRYSLEGFRGLLQAFFWCWAYFSKKALNRSFCAIHKYFYVIHLKLHFHHWSLSCTIRSQIYTHFFAMNPLSYMFPVSIFLASGSKTFFPLSHITPSTPCKSIFCRLLSWMWSVYLTSSITVNNKALLAYLTRVHYIYSKYLLMEVLKVISFASGTVLHSSIKSPELFLSGILWHFSVINRNFTCFLIPG